VVPVESDPAVAVGMDSEVFQVEGVIGLVLEQLHGGAVVLL
jgi:hypothetical protein